MDKSKKGSSYIRYNSKEGIDIGFLEFSDSLIVRVIGNVLTKHCQYRLVLLYEAVEYLICDLLDFI